MNRFLSECADYILEKHKSNLKDCCLVFPNRRSGVFFNAYLQEKIDQPIIGPSITTINELITSWSDLIEAEKLQLIASLYPIFKKHTQSKEIFDEFYFWGEVLLRDFNDVDGYLIDAKDLFSNIANLKEIDSSLDYLTDEQKSALSQFWGVFNEDEIKGNQKKFIEIWKVLYPVYNEFTTVLKNDNIGYSGMIYRSVAESLAHKSINTENKSYYIIGLNALNSCERKIFKHLQAQECVSFFWDYDTSYVDDTIQEAGMFIRENLKDFPSPEDFRQSTHNLENDKKIKLVGVSSNYAQAQEIPNFLKQNNDYNRFDDTAIVLADESLLFPALSAIEKDFGSINVTMGYPVKNSVVYGFLSLLVQLLKNKRIRENKTVAYHQFVTPILNHQLVNQFETEKTNQFITDITNFNLIDIELEKIDFSELHRLIFSPPEKVKEYSQYILQILQSLYVQFRQQETKDDMLIELLYAVYLAIERLQFAINDTLANSKGEIGEAVYFRLFDQYVGQVSVAFEGEPLSGLQVMGVLETRCLDFENVLVLGLNEGKWPRKFSAPSFIPFNIGKGFGLPTIDEQEAIYAYYFYRLLQRSENFTATYSTIKVGISTGELSRYGYQLIYDSKKNVQKNSLDFIFKKDSSGSIKMKGSKEKTAMLLERNSKERPLSPTAINMYLSSSLRYYFRYIMRIPEPDEVVSEIDSPLFGTIFHDVLESIYTPFIGKSINPNQIAEIRKNKSYLLNEINKSIWNNYYKIPYDEHNKRKLDGKSMLVFENVKNFIDRVLKIDEAYTPFTIVDLEGKYSGKLNVNVDGVDKEIYVGGKIDRVDQKNGVFRILDYKTGDVESLNFDRIEDLFSQEKKNKKEALQALIYSYVFSEKYGEEYQYSSAVYCLRKIFSDNFNPNVTLNKNQLFLSDIKDEFINALKGLLAEMFSSETEFKPSTAKDVNNNFDPYRKIYELF